jgi:hypothetical protein
MNTGGWIFMITSLSLVWSVTIWSYWKLIKSPPPDQGGPKPPATNL